MAEHDLRAVAFPTLNEAQIEKLGSCAGAFLKKYPDGQTLFKVGERDFKFFVVKCGEVEIIDESGDTPKTVTVHRPGEFTGEVAQLTGSPAVVSAIARGDTEVYEMSAESVRQFLNTYPDLADIILQAFIARRQLLRESGNFTGLRVIGSRYSQDTFRIRDFLSRNRILFTWLDSGDRSSSGPIAQALRSYRSRNACGCLHTDAAPAQPVESRTRRRDRHPSAAGANNVRLGRGWSGAGRAGSGGLRCLRRTQCGRAGANGARGTSQPQYAHRELPRFPHGHNGQ